MKSIKSEFPNPVLASGRDDYIDSCYFYTSFDENKISVDAESIKFSIQYTLKCNGLEEMVKSGQAVVVVLIKSSAASYSKLFRFTSDSNELEISIPKYAVVSKVDICGSIVASDNIPHFRCADEFNELYFGTSTFEIRKGDILATEDSRSIYVDDSELERPISSVFEICRNDDQDSDVMLDFYSQKIKILLKSELYELYYKFKDFNNGVLRRYAAGIIVYPVLVEAIMYITGHYQNGQQEDGSDFSEKRWFRAIDHKAEIMGINLQNYQDSPTTLANNLLGDIALDALKSFKVTLDSEINSGETQMIGGVD